MPPLRIRERLPGSSTTNSTAISDSFHVLSPTIHERDIVAGQCEEATEERTHRTRAEYCETHLLLYSITRRQCELRRRSRRSSSDRFDSPDRIDCAASQR